MQTADLKRYETLLRTHVGVRWTNEDVRALLDEVKRLRAVLEEPEQKPEPWFSSPRFVGGH